MEPDLPWLPEAVRLVLVEDPGVTADVGQRVSTRSGVNVNMPFVLVEFPTPLGVMGGGGYKPIVQVTASCPEGGSGTLDPEKLVWRIAMRAKRALEAVRNRRYQTVHWSARVIDAGPLPADVSRGTSVPLYRAMVRAELTVHNH